MAVAIILQPHSLVSFKGGTHQLSGAAYAERTLDSSTTKPRPIAIPRSLVGMMVFSLVYLNYVRLLESQIRYALEISLALSGVNSFWLDAGRQNTREHNILSGYQSRFEILSNIDTDRPGKNFIKATGSFYSGQFRFLDRYGNDANMYLAQGKKAHSAAETMRLGFKEDLKWVKRAGSDARATVRKSKTPMSKDARAKLDKVITKFLEGVERDGIALEKMRAQLKSVKKKLIKLRGRDREILLNIRQHWKNVAAIQQELRIKRSSDDSSIRIELLMNEVKTARKESEALWQNRRQIWKEIKATQRAIEGMYRKMKLAEATGLRKIKATR